MGKMSIIVASLYHLCKGRPLSRIILQTFIDHGLQRTTPYKTGIVDIQLSLIVRISDPDWLWRISFIVSKCSQDEAGREDIGLLIELEIVENRKIPSVDEFVLFWRHEIEGAAMA